MKTKMRYHYTPIRRTKIHGTENLKCEREVEKRNSHLFQVGMQNDTATLEDSSAITYKAKHSLTIGYDNHASRCFSHGVEKLRLPKNLHMNIYNNYVNNHPKLKAIEMSLNR